MTIKKLKEKETEARIKRFKRCVSEMLRKLKKLKGKSTF